MAWTDLKASVATVIKTNGNQEITGALLQSTLNSIIDQVGANSTFKGVATPSTNPGTPDGPIFYLAVEKGVYSNFSGQSVSNSDGLVVLLYSSVWEKHNLPIATKTDLSMMEASIRGVYTDLTQVDMFLQDAITAETQARQNADSALQASIENLSGEIGSESLARTEGDNALQASINQEILDRQNEIQGLAQTVNSNTEEIQNEITNRAQTVNALRNELLNKSIGSIATGAEEKPAEGVNRRYRFTDDGNCYFTDVLNGLTFDVMPVPFQVSKDDELSVIIFGGDYTYIYFPTMTELKNSIGDISSALDEILLIGGSI